MRRPADAVADFLEKHREFDRMGQFGEAIHLPGEVGIASGLHGLLQGLVCTASASAPTRRTRELS